MMKSDFKMHKLIERYYGVWINGPTLLEHSLDREGFYRFVKACIRYSRHWNATQDINGAWLRYFLERDLGERYSDEIIVETVILFQRILDFNKTSFPDSLVEMRNPFLVSLALRRCKRIDKDGKEVPYYSEQEIEGILEDNFGPSWRERYGG